MAYDETIALRITVTGGKHWPDDFVPVTRRLGAEESEERFKTTLK